MATLQHYIVSTFLSKQQFLTALSLLGSFCCYSHGRSSTIYLAIIYNKIQNIDTYNIWNETGLCGIIARFRQILRLEHLRVAFP